VLGTSSVTETPFGSIADELSAVIYGEDGTFGGSCFASLPFSAESSVGSYYLPNIPTPETPTRRPGIGWNRSTFQNTVKYAEFWSDVEASQHREKLLREDEELLIMMKVIALCC